MSSVKSGRQHQPLETQMHAVLPNITDHDMMHPDDPRKSYHNGILRDHNDILGGQLQQPTQELQKNTVEESKGLFTTMYENKIIVLIIAIVIIIILIIAYIILRRSDDDMQQHPPAYTRPPQRQQYRQQPPPQQLTSNQQQQQPQQLNQQPQQPRQQPTLPNTSKEELSNLRKALENRKNGGGSQQQIPESLETQENDDEHVDDDQVSANMSFSQYDSNKYNSDWSITDCELSEEIEDNYEVTSEILNDQNPIDLKCDYVLPKSGRHCSKNAIVDGRCKLHAGKK